MVIVKYENKLWFNATIVSLYDLERKFDLHTTYRGITSVFNVHSISDDKAVVLISTTVLFRTFDAYDYLYSLKGVKIHSPNEDMLDGEYTDYCPHYVREQEYYRNNINWYFHQ